MGRDCLVRWSQQKLLSRFVMLPRFAGPNQNMAEVLHETVWFSGHVQGVGFRYTTTQVAREYEVTGLVQNLTDGRVLLDCEGEEREVAAFVTAVSDRLHGYIRKVERRSERRPAQFSGFAIR